MKYPQTWKYLTDVCGEFDYNQNGESNYILINSGESDSFWINQLPQYTLDLAKTRACRSIAALENKTPFNGLVFKKGHEPIQSCQDAIITWAGGHNFCKTPGFNVYVNSLNRCGFNGDKIIFTHDMALDDRERLIKQEFKIVDVSSNFEWVLRDRFYHWSNFLQTSSYRYVGFFDSKDCVFQTNPMNFVRRSYGAPSYLVSEGKKHHECEWNSKEQEKLQKHFREFKKEYLEWEVLCGGTMIGEPAKFKNLFRNIWCMTLMNRDSFTDQAALNYIYRAFDNLLLEVTDPRTSDFVVTADLPKDKGTTNKFEDGVMYASTGLPYCVYHQYDRIPEIREIIYKKYNEES